jgi:hypothetical protein
MSLPFHLQKLPAEALDVLRYLGKTSAAASPDAMEAGTKLPARTIGKAIRRLVNYDYIVLGANGAYQLTTDGKIAVQQIAEHDSGGGQARAGDQKKEMRNVQRRLAIVLPRTLVAGQATDLYIGVNPPTGNDKLPGPATVELKVSAVGGSVSADSVSLNIPPDKAATPRKLSLTPARTGRLVRVRVDAFQSLDSDSMEPLGGMYFDVQVAAGAAPEKTTRAVGMDLLLRPPR